jgi:hypothetical protein
MLSLKEVESKFIDTDIISEFIFTQILGFRVGDRIISIYNKETVPSLFVYYDDNYKTLKYKDFSSDRWGDGITLLKDVILLKPSLVKDELLKKKIKPNTSYNTIKSLVYRLYHTDIEKYKENRDEWLSNKSNNKNIVVGEYKSPIYDICDNPLLYEYFKSYKVDEKDLSKFRIMSLCGLTYKDYNLNDRLIIGYFNKFGGLIQGYVPKEYSDSGKKKFVTIVNEPVIYYNKVNCLEPLNIFVYGAVKDNVAFSNYLFKKTDKNIIGISVLSEKVILEEDILKIVLTNLNSKRICNKYRMFLMFDFDETGLKKSMETIKDERNKNIYPTNIMIKNILTDDNIKDVSDLIKNYREEELNKIFKMFVKNYLL